MPLLPSDCAAGLLYWPAARANRSKLPCHKGTFLQTKKNPPKRVCPKTIIDSLSAAILAHGRSSMILKHSLCFS